jgi:uncharacterized SAM-binding protein YcdF (DUF218 family)
MFRKILKRFFITFGCITFLMFILAFTSAPFWIWYSLSIAKSGINRPPEYIVVMGGGAMPGGSAMIRTWYGAKAGMTFPKSKNMDDSLSTLRQMIRELELRGIPADRIIPEDSGTNTRSQALNVFTKITNYGLRITDSSSHVPRPTSFVLRHASRVTRHSSLLIVSSPEHIYRAVKSFRKAGFLKVDGLPAFEPDIEGDISFNSGKLGGRKWIPDIGKSIYLRYKFWSQMKYELLVLREYFAIAYYWLNGWI